MRFQRTEEAKVIDDAVARWATWARNRGGAAVGWPSTSPSWRLAEQNRIGIRYEPGFVSNYMDPDIERMDSLIAGLPDQLKRVIEANYFVYGAIEIRAQKVDLKPSRFKELLKAALLVLAARLANANYLIAGSRQRPVAFGNV